MARSGALLIRDPGCLRRGNHRGPGSAAHHYARLRLRHSASKTRVNALAVLRCARDTCNPSVRNTILVGFTLADTAKAKPPRIDRTCPQNGIVGAGALAMPPICDPWSMAAASAPQAPVIPT